MKILISRTDNIGDVVLSLPVAGKLKESFPEATIGFIGKKYTQPLIDACQAVDVFIDKDKLEQGAVDADIIIFLYPDKDVAKWAFRQKIKIRIGTSHRWWHWIYCNKRVSFSRKKSDLHEAQLNFKLLAAIGISDTIDLSEIPALYKLKNNPKNLPGFVKELLQTNRKKVILHPKSKGSAREWSMENYYLLAKVLSDRGYEVFVTGSEAEGKLIESQKPEIFKLPQVTQLAGKLTLSELINLIGEIDVLVACSTGPLHIASALGKKAIGMYPNLRPMHPGRWKPVGNDAHVLVLDKPDCTDCKNTPEQCACIKAIAVSQVLELIDSK
jgi:ADP-heptose:LPS heptosyltransferase